LDTRKKDRKELGFYRARLDDTDVLYKVIDEEKFPRAIYQLIQALKNPDIYIMVSDADDAIIIYEPAYGMVPWLNTHSHTLKSARGRKLKELYWKTGCWIFENTRYTAITCVIPEDFRHHGIFLGAIGATRQFEVDGTVMYTWDIETQYEQVKEKLKCLKD